MGNAANGRASALLVSSRMRECCSIVSISSLRGASPIGSSRTRRPLAAGLYTGGWLFSRRSVSGRSNGADGERSRSTVWKCSSRFSRTERACAFGSAKTIRKFGTLSSVDSLHTLASSTASRTGRTSGSFCSSSMNRDSSKAPSDLAAYVLLRMSAKSVFSVEKSFSTYARLRDKVSHISYTRSTSRSLRSSPGKRGFLSHAVVRTA